MQADPDHSSEPLSVLAHSSPLTNVALPEQLTLSRKMHKMTIKMC